MKKQLTLCLIHESERILLGMKKRGVGKDFWNGFGGKVAPGESIEDATRREVFEEVGLIVPVIDKIGVLDFQFGEDPEIWQVHVFRAEKWEGEPIESDEMRPKWFTIDAIPFDDMWADDKYWFPLFLEGKKFTGSFVFDKENGIVEHEIREVEVI